MKMLSGSDGILAVPPFLNLALDKGKWSTSRQGRFIPREEPPLPGAQSQSGHRALKKNKNLPPLPGLESQFVCPGCGYTDIARLPKVITHTKNILHGCSQSLRAYARIVP
jgi:predicted RNA-binding Zn-ribbon protein involved in translation (DUF1610 family)